MHSLLLSSDSKRPFAKQLKVKAAKASLGTHSESIKGEEFPREDSLTFDWPTLKVLFVPVEISYHVK